MVLRRPTYREACRRGPSRSGLWVSTSPIRDSVIPALRHNLMPLDEDPTFPTGASTTAHQRPPSGEAHRARFFRQASTFRAPMSTVSILSGLGIGPVWPIPCLALPCSDSGIDAY